MLPPRDVVADRFCDCRQLRLEDLGRNAGLRTCLSKDGRICIPSLRDAFESHAEPHDPLKGRSEAITVDAIAAAQKSAVNIEQIGVLPVPGKAVFDCYPRFFI